MSVGWRRWPSPQTLYELSIKHNILVPVILLLIAFGFKVLDIFVLRLDELLGEIILSKSIGFLIIIIIRTIEGLDSDVIVFQVALSIGFIIITLLFRKLVKWFQMPEVKPWGREVSQ